MYHNKIHVNIGTKRLYPMQAHFQLVFQERILNDNLGLWIWMKIYWNKRKVFNSFILYKKIKQKWSKNGGKGKAKVKKKTNKGKKNLPNFHVDNQVM